jgi:hypothetical protein
MTKRFKVQQEMDEAIKQQNTTVNDDECGVCHTKYYGSKCLRESHQGRYPSHFTDKPAPNLQVDAQPQIYQTKRKRRKHTEETEEPTDN